VVFDKSSRSNGKPIIAQDSRVPHTSQPERLSSSKQFSRALLPGLLNKKAGSELPGNLTITHALTSLQDYARLLKDSDPIVREDAVLQLAAEYNDEAISYLEDVLVRDSNSAVRSAAAEEIAFIGGDAGIEALVKGLNDTDDEIRETVVTALGDIGGKSVLPALTMAMTDSNEDIKAAASDLIEEINDEGHDIDSLPPMLAYGLTTSRPGKLSSR
jgi:hypothetical protein